VDKSVSDIFDSLQKLIGLHRQLLEICRAERDALVQAEIKAIQEATLAKQGVIEHIRQAETERLKRVGGLAMKWKKPLRELSLPNIILDLQAADPKAADQLRSAYNALTILIQRITEQNDDNRRLVERSLEHVNEMKKNVLGEAVPKSNTYTARGERAATTGGARLISKEI
jgi:flagellar biosynthesis/type III secretory pathway chaperone